MGQNRVKLLRARMLRIEPRAERPVTVVRPYRRKHQEVRVLVSPRSCDNCEEKKTETIEDPEEPGASDEV